MSTSISMVRLEMYSICLICNLISICTNTSNNKHNNTYVHCVRTLQFLIHINTNFKKEAVNVYFLIRKYEVIAFVIVTASTDTWLTEDTATPSGRSY